MDAKHIASEADSPTPLSALLRRLRQQAGITMSQLATRSGYDRSNLRRVEEGKMSLTPETAQKLAEALDVDVEAFYDAIWQTSDDPLPSLPVYFRHRYQDLTPEQISEVEHMVNAMHQHNQQRRP